MELEKNKNLQFDLQVEKKSNFPTFTQNKRRGVVPIWRARKNQEKAKDQQKSTLKGVE
jgi:hypothetical protein